MAAPVVNTITPNEGNSIGVTLVTIDGTGFNLAAVGTVRVFFDNEEATEVQVVSSTKLYCLAPRTIQDTLPATIDVRVENVTPQPDPNPPLVEPTTVAGGYTYRRPSIATDDNAENACVVKITQSLIREFRRYILENTHHDMHPEYVDSFSATAEEEKQSAAPNIKLMGPQIQEDLFYRESGRITVDNQNGTFTSYDEPTTLMLEYSFVAIGRSSAEVLNLWTAATKYFQRTEFLVVPQDGVDPANGFVEYEIEPIPEQRADVRTVATRQGVYQATGVFMIRGVPILADPIRPGYEVVEDGTTIEFEQKT